jgi:hypothetical protein
MVSTPPSEIQHVPFTQPSTPTYLMSRNFVDLCRLSVVRPLHQNLKPTAHQNVKPVSFILLIENVPSSHDVDPFELF